MQFGGEENEVREMKNMAEASPIFFPENQFKKNG
jgi:hypothetical protein